MTTADLVMVRGMDVLRGAMLGWLDSLTADYPVVWGLGNLPQGKQAEPHILLQPEPRGQVKRYIGMPAGWIGTLTMRVRAADLTTATERTDDAAALIPERADLVDDDYAPGWALRILPISPLVGMPGPRIATAGVIYRIDIRPKEAA